MTRTHSESWGISVNNGVKTFLPDFNKSPLDVSTLYFDLENRVLGARRMVKRVRFRLDFFEGKFVVF